LTASCFCSSCFFIRSEGLTIALNDVTLAGQGGTNSGLDLGGIRPAGSLLLSIRVVGSSFERETLRVDFFSLNFNGGITYQSFLFK
jgi:hypothetical protein